LAQYGRCLGRDDVAVMPFRALDGRDGTLGLHGSVTPYLLFDVSKRRTPAKYRICLAHRQRGIRRSKYWIIGTRTDRSEQFGIVITGALTHSRSVSRWLHQEQDGDWSLRRRRRMRWEPCSWSWSPALAAHARIMSCGGTARSAETEPQLLGFQEISGEVPLPWSSALPLAPSLPRGSSPHPCHSFFEPRVAPLSTHRRPLMAGVH
jgi:hypothetical protein